MYLLSLENVRMTGSGQNDATGCAILETMESLVWFCEARIASYSVEQAKYLKLRHRIMYFEGLEENYQCTLRLKAAKNVGIHLDREHVWNKLTLTFDDINAIHSEYHKDIVDREGEDSELEWDFNLGVLAALRALEHLWEDLHGTFYIYFSLSKYNLLTMSYLRYRVFGMAEVR